MASYYYGHSFPRVFVGTGAFMTSGDTSQLAAGEIGIFDKSTFAALDVTATVPTAFLKRQLIVAQGSYHTVDSLTESALTDMYGGLQESVKSLGILPRNITSFTKVTPRRASGEQWIIGWDGVNAGCAAAPECDSVYTIRLDVKGDPVLKLHNRNYYKKYTVQTDCCEGCETCTNDLVDPKVVMENFRDQINNDPGMKKYVIADLIYSDTSAIDIHANALDAYTVVTGAAVTEAELLAAYPAATHIESVSDTEWYVGGPAVVPAALDVVGATTVTTATLDRKILVRDLCINLPVIDGITNLTDVNTWITSLGRTDITAATLKGSGVTQEEFTLEQSAETTVAFSTEILGVPTYADLTDYGQYNSDGELVLTVSWDACACETDAAFAGQVGLRLTAAFVEKKFGDCSFRPMDHYNLDGIRLQVSLEDDASLCTPEEWPVIKTQSFQQAVGLGESVLRKYLLNNGYRTSNERFDYDPRWREAEDQNHLDVVDRTAYYQCLTINHYIPHNLNSMGMTGLNNDQTYNLDFFFEESVDISDFEARLTELAAEGGADLVTY